MAGDRARLTLVAPEAEFVYKPLAIAEPFGLGHAHRVPLTRFAEETGAELLIDALEQVDDGFGRARLAGGATVYYDQLIVATGGRPVAGVAGATTWWPGGDPEVYGGLLRDLEEGYAKRLAIVVPPGAVWPLPAYELALMTAGEASAMGHDDVEVTVVTPERAPLSLFGDDVSSPSAEELATAGVAPADRRGGRDGRQAARPPSRAASASTCSASSACRGCSARRSAASRATTRASSASTTWAGRSGRADVGRRRRHRLPDQVRRSRDPPGAPDRRRDRARAGRGRPGPRRAGPAGPAPRRRPQPPAARPRRRRGRAAVVAGRQGRGAVPAAVAGRARARAARRVEPPDGGVEVSGR